MANATLSKCPACGSLRQSFAAVCPECGYEFPDIQESAAIQKFTDKIDEYDRLIAQQGDGKSSGVGFWTVVGWLFLFPLMFCLYILKKLRMKHEQLQGPEKLKSESILNFPVPNSRNDLMEFAIMVESRVKPLSYLNALTSSGMDIQKWNLIWESKANQIEKKAEIALKDDKTTLSRIRTSFQNVRETIKKNNQMQWIMMGGLGVLFIFVLIAASVN